MIEVQNGKTMRVKYRTLHLFPKDGEKLSIILMAVLIE
jgi:hypothetical protein